nr:immunoglobulin heavy chain junction region [Mus musculus]MBK4184007.1 immunoglobulin heavy chain junction region [Mus musculus]
CARANWPYYFDYW